MDQKPAFRLYTLGSFGLSKVRYALVGMEAPRPIVKHGVTNQEIGQKKRRPIHSRSGAWILSGLSGGQVLLLITTKGPTERTGFRIFRRKVEDTASFRRLGSVEPAAERARELTSGVTAVRVN